jgi:hypothetical protein
MLPDSQSIFADPAQFFSNSGEETEKKLFLKAAASSVKGNKESQFLH